MIRAFSFLVLLFAGLVIFFGQIPSAAAQETSFSALRNDFSIVPQVCGKEGQGECNACDFAQLINNVFDFLIFAATVVATFMFLYAGFLLITAGDSDSDRSKARTVMTNVVVGFVFLLGSWVIVDTIMKAFLKNNGQLEINGSLPTKWGPWNNIICPPGFVPNVGKAPDKGINLGSINEGNSSTSSGPVGALESDEITHDAAMSALCKAKVLVWSSTTQTQDPCTEPIDGATTCNGVKENTIRQVVNVANICGSENTIVTGCSEDGHTSGVASHGNGFKIDLEDTSALNACLQKRLTPAGTRSGTYGGPIYKDKCGNEYVYENSGHWDLTITKQPCLF